MKLFYLLFAVAFISGLHAEDMGLEEEQMPGDDDMEGEIPLEDQEVDLAEITEDSGLEKEPEGKERSRRLCRAGLGYCLPRELLCSSGYQYVEKYNDCPLRKQTKCCVR